MIRLFIGWDQRETVAFHTLAHSIIKRSSEPVSITPIGNQVLPKTLWFREPGEYDSTEFSNARFIVPKLCEYEGWGLFMDCDMLCQADIAELWAQRDDSKALLVKKQQQEVIADTKFLGAEQTVYERKNWSSLMLINCEHPIWRHIDANRDPGLELHQFMLLEDDDIGSIEGDWNYLVQPRHRDRLSHDGSLAHFTLGGPWHGWVQSHAAIEWMDELVDLVAGGNPCASGFHDIDRGTLLLAGCFRALPGDLDAMDQ